MSCGVKDKQRSNGLWTDSSDMMSFSHLPNQKFANQLADKLKTAADLCERAGHF